MKRFLTMLTVLVVLALMVSFAVRVRAAPNKATSTYDCNHMELAAYASLSEGITSSKTLWAGTYGADGQIVRETISYKVVGTSDGDNYWSFHFRNLGDPTDIFYLATSHGRCGNGSSWQNCFMAGTYDIDGPGMAVYVEKVGSPGALYTAAPAICMQ